MLLFTNSPRARQTRHVQGCCAHHKERLAPVLERCLAQEGLREVH